MDKRAKGNIGEEIACKYLRNKGFTIIARNYLKRWGELDIVAQKDNIVHFYEIKSVRADFEFVSDIHRPEDNVHGLKVRKIMRMIETFLAEKFDDLDKEFQFHVICVYLDMFNGKARVKLIENIIL